MSGAEMRRSGVSRQVTDDVVTSHCCKSMLFGSLIKFWDSIRGIDKAQMARLAEVSASADVISRS